MRVTRLQGTGIGIAVLAPFALVGLYLGERGAILAMISVVGLAFAYLGIGSPLLDRVRGEPSILSASMQRLGYAMGGIFLLTVALAWNFLY